MEKILILDFGSQTTALIGRRIREFGVYTEIIPGNTEFTDDILDGTAGIILGGSPEAVYGNGLVPDKRIYNGIPILGICYGLQRIMADLGGKVEALKEREYGGVEVYLNKALKTSLSDRGKAFLDAVDDSLTAWMSHGDTVTKLAPDFIECGTSKTGFPSVVIHKTKPFFGVQFHPEVSHTKGGEKFLKAFVFDVCGCKKSWSMEKYLQEIETSLKSKVGSNHVLLLISGGVDSTVAGALLLKRWTQKKCTLCTSTQGLCAKTKQKLSAAI
ncbi:MAG: gamma-glutamyl-gamma-aminobutyrate hydrolase family protein [Spirochaetaceae bacterium]|jgi:GMP synthase (glutamine-hydrolysing)|nr:gamma-glutamyl-gamma-aminobutyrate hydrolase family protein [Spirochaetaceae bacterium]